MEGSPRTLRGLIGPRYRAVRRRLESLIYERGLTDTSEIVWLDRLGLEARDRVEYVPSGYVVLWRAFRGLQIGPDDVVVDFGAGKGRAVIAIARRFPARRVVGVELAPTLAAIAEENIAAVRHRLKAREVTIVTSDVLDFPIPDDMTYAYFFNPFRGDVFPARCSAALVESLDRVPRQVTIVYYHPTMEDAIAATGRFERIRDSRGMGPGAGRELRNGGIAHLRRITARLVSAISDVGPRRRGVPDHPLAAGRPDRRGAWRDASSAGRLRGSRLAIVRGMALVSGSPPHTRLPAGLAGEPRL